MKLFVLHQACGGESFHGIQPLLQLDACKRLRYDMNMIGHDHEVTHPQTPSMEEERRMCYQRLGFLLPQRAAAVALIEFEKKSPRHLTLKGCACVGVDTCHCLLKAFGLPTLPVNVDVLLKQPLRLVLLPAQNHFRWKRIGQTEGDEVGGSDQPPVRQVAFISRDEPEILSFLKSSENRACRHLERLRQRLMWHGGVVARNSDSATAFSRYRNTELQPIHENPHRHLHLHRLTCRH